VVPEGQGFWVECTDCGARWEQRPHERGFLAREARGDAAPGVRLLDGTMRDLIALKERLGGMKCPACGCAYDDYGDVTCGFCGVKSSPRDIEHWEVYEMIDAVWIAVCTRARGRLIAALFGGG